MDWSSIAQYVELCLGFVLVGKLLSLDLQRVYKYFAIFLIADISGILIWAFQKRMKGTPLHFDYRLAWLTEMIVLWVFTLLTVYALLDAMLANLPGILRLSRRVLNVSFCLAIIVGILTALPEYRAAAASEALLGRLAHIVAAAIVFDRVIDSVALLALIVILLFLIWFPVEMSRNLVAFFTGFVIFFALRTCFTLALTLGSNGSPAFIRFTNMLDAGLAAAVFAYWTFAISRSGENVPAKLSLASFSRQHEDTVLAQLEAMNTSLLRAVRR